MRINQNNREAGPRVIALGMFDGVHRGHQELIRQGLELARRMNAVLEVRTFDRHPLEILRPEAAPRLLSPGEEQAERMAACGAEELTVMPFTAETAGTEPEDFLAGLRAAGDLKAVVAGWNYSFGRGGRGDAELLRKDGAEHGYQVLIVPPVKNDRGEVISSSAIRERLTDGRLREANEMLGGPYTIRGPVVNGKHEGSRIGFPTANIQPDSRKQLPAYGVYTCRLLSCGDSWNAVVNIGTQPTLPSGNVTVEAHAMEAHPDLYGKEARVELLQYLRPERKFRSGEELAEQIRRDTLTAERFFREKTARD